MLSIVIETFTAWLLNELEIRGWSQAELARQAGLSRAAISNILSYQRQPGPDACSAIAKALDLPPELVFRAAGLLPEDEERPLTFIEWVFLYMDSTPEEREQLLAWARAFRETRKKKSENNSARDPGN